MGREKSRRCAAAGLTVKEKGISVAEVEESREGADAVALGERDVLDLDHVYPVDVTLVVDVLQLLEDDVAGATVRLVCRDVRSQESGERSQVSRRKQGRKD